MLHEGQSDVLLNGEGELKVTAPKAEPPKLYTGPPIPRSVIWHILTHLRNEPSTLVRCMRVSPDFHAVAAPLLYSVVKLPTYILCGCPPGDKDNGICWRHAPNPLALVPSHVARITEDKETSLSRIQGIIVNGHEPEDCGQYMDDLAALDPARLTPKWVRLNYLSDDRHPVYSHCDEEDRLSGERSCTVIEWLRPEKLVIDGMSMIRPFPTHQRIPRSVKKLVTIITERGWCRREEYGEEDEYEDEYDSREEWERYDDYDWPERLPSPIDSIHTGDGSSWPLRVKKAEWWPDELSLDALTSVDHLVYIFFTSSIHSKRFSGLVRSNIHKTKEKFCQQTFEKIRQMRPTTVTIVNSTLFGPHGASYYDECSDDGTWAYERVEFEDDFRGRWDVPASSARSDEPINLEFLSLEDYLQKYDWAGEFDEEDIRPWAVSGLADRLREEHRQAELARWKADAPRRRRQALRELGRCKFRPFYDRRFVLTGQSS